MIHFRRADERDLAAVVSVLTAAFAEHEIYREKFRPLFGSSQSYIDFLNRLHAVMVKAAMRHHICLLAEVDGRLMAVATIHKLGTILSVCFPFCGQEHGGCGNIFLSF